jgi:hypothetical protein
MAEKVKAADLQVDERIDMGKAEQAMRQLVAVYGLPQLVDILHRLQEEAKAQAAS